MSHPALSHPRFVIHRQIGSGGMGIVYEAFDRERGTLVALKKVLHTSPRALIRLKQEFRALADVAHPNLVPLYELFGDEAEWFFTMELVPGTDFLTYVRQIGNEDEIFDRETLVDEGERDTATVPDPRPRNVGARARVHIELLRDALVQLIRGVQALHDAGKLHRDLKPSNVMVRPDGRVVILDFGLVADITPFGRRNLTFGGTPAYMSPEQMSGAPITAASDWYTVGVMLFEALTGRVPPLPLPIGDDASHAEPSIPLEAATPRDLNDLCIALLAATPERRPSGPELLRRLGATETVTVSRTSSARSVFIGRERELERLHAAHKTVRHGSPVTALIHGGSGIGKSSLIQHFLETVTRDHPDAVILRGRCYEQESMPFKALDSLIDDLMRYARRLNTLEVKAIVPLDIGFIARLFPVLEPLVLTTRQARRVSEIPDSQESRRRAFAALREMLMRIADSHPLILFLDDLQWGDRDSAGVLSELLGPPDPPPALVLLSYRTNEPGISPLVSEINRMRAGAALRDVLDMPVPAFSLSEAAQMAQAIGEMSEDEAKAIARASDGSPLFVAEMARLTASGDARERGTVDDLIRSRVDRLPAAAREVLKIVAVAGQPIQRNVIELAARKSDPDAVLTLRANHLVHSRTIAGREHLVTHHDRFREAVLGALAEEERTALHRALAVALEETGCRDPEVLATHFARGGQPTRAAAYAVAAAENASATLAFDHAARLCKLALELDPSIASADEIRIRLGDALANAGRGGEAAPHYLAAAQRAETDAALELRRRAAENLLRGGHVDAGIAVVQEVLAAVGMELPPTPRRALIGIILGRLRLALRGMRAKKATGALDPQTSLKIDICWSVIIGLARIDNIRSVYFQPIHLRAALDSGDPYRISRALGVEAGFAGTRGGPGRHQALRILERTEKHARSVGHPHAVGFSSLAASVVHFYLGEFRRSLDAAERAEQMLRDQCTGVTWEINTAQNYILSSLAYLGEINELSRRVPLRLREARERGDLYASTDPAGRAGVVWLAADEPDQARLAITRPMEQWSLIGFHFQHFIEMYAHSQIDLYLGDPAAAYARVTERWTALRGSMLLRIQFNRIEAVHLRGRSAVALAKRTGAASLLDEAMRDARSIAREKMSWSRPLADALRAAVEELRGNRAGALEAMRAAMTGFDRAQMALHAAVARHRLGNLVGGEAGAALMSDARQWFDAQGVKRVDALANVVIPGF